MITFVRKTFSLNLFKFHSLRRGIFNEVKKIVACDLKILTHGLWLHVGKMIKKWRWKNYKRMIFINVGCCGAAVHYINFIKIYRIKFLKFLILMKLSQVLQLPINIKMSSFKWTIKTCCCWLLIIETINSHSTTCTSISF